MANRRNKIVDAIVNPAAMPGLSIIADTVTVTGNDKDLTITFPCKSIIGVFVSPQVGADESETVTWSATVTNDVASVVLTSITGSAVVASYMILYTMTETLTANGISGDATQTPTT